MKKRFLFPVLLLLLCLSCSTVYATNTDEEKTESITLTEENRYDPVYYQEPEELYPVAKARMERSGAPSLEECVVNALEQFQDKIDVSAYRIPSAEAGTKYLQILNSHPSLFYVKSTASWSYSKSTNLVVSYNVTYNMDKNIIKSQQTVFEQEIDQALTWTDNSMTDVEKALAVHDYLVLHCEYDKERLDNNTVPDVSHSAYGALVEEIAVCDGYAKAYFCILEKLNIPRTIVSSDSMHHAWNLVKIGGNWYHVDVTWDDPTWDCIGRVMHTYFLLSDTAIANAGPSGNTHYGWDNVDNIANSKIYDDGAPWSGITSAFCYQNGSWYYARYNTTDRGTSLMKRSGKLESQEEILYTEPETWNYYTTGYMYLDLEPTENELYFNTRTAIYKLDENEKTVKVHEPEISGGEQLIFGFTVRGSRLCYALQTDPNLSGKQVIFEYTLEDTPFPEIEGVSAKDIDTVYTGNPTAIVLQGTLDSDTVTYKVAGAYQKDQPEMINAGTYQVSYKVERAGYKSYFGNVKVTIRKVTPEYPSVTGLKGNSGSLLSQVVLPSHFIWEDGTTKLRETGEKTFYVSYVPDDTLNYETVSRIPVTVTVNCPGHTYTETVTAAPTMTQEGKAVCTCSLCGDTYTKTLPVLSPDHGSDDGNTGNSENLGNNESTGNNENTGNTQQPEDIVPPEKPAKASGLKLSKATANSLKFSWKKVTGVNYRLVLSNGKKTVSTVYTTGNSHNYKKLNAATVYTLKVTPYVEASGTKLYASSTTSFKAATSPAKSKLLTVKKKGNAKATITWKKVTDADGYEISMRTGKGSYKVIKTVTKGKTVSFTKSGLKKGTNYSFRVRAYKKAGSKKTYGSYSNIKTLKMK
ncbi:MAG TPA: hypothetical protein DF613_11380 [Lachnospiraceae bacterium]|nr:hypothetical protein [Lachnospiraceae bacterium]